MRALRYMAVEGFVGCVSAGSIGRPGQVLGRTRGAGRALCLGAYKAHPDVTLAEGVGGQGQSDGGNERPRDKAVPLLAGCLCVTQPLELGRHLGTGLDLPLESSLELTYSLVRGGLGFCRILPLVEELRLELRDPRLVAHALVIVQLALVLERSDVLERGR